MRANNAAYLRNCAIALLGLGLTLTAHQATAKGMVRSDGPGDRDSVAQKSAAPSQEQRADVRVAPSSSRPTPNASSGSPSERTVSAPTRNAQRSDSVNAGRSSAGPSYAGRGDSRDNVRAARPRVENDSRADSGSRYNAAPRTDSRTRSDGRDAARVTRDRSGSVIGNRSETRDNPRSTGPNVANGPRTGTARRPGYEDDRDSSRSRTSMRSIVTRRDERRDPPPGHNLWERDHPRARLHRPWFSHYRYDTHVTILRPSLYFFYTDYCPPYIDPVRVIVIPSYVRHYYYTDVPYVVISDDDDYYLVRSAPARYAYSGVLDNIRRAWLRGDYDLMSDYVWSGSTIAVLSKDEYSYSIAAEDYADITSDAMESIETRSFEFYRVRQRDDDRIVAYARHQYYNSSDELKTMYVSYTLERNGGDWQIVEAGSSPYKID